MPLLLVVVMLLLAAACCCWLANRLAGWLAGWLAGLAWLGWLGLDRGLESDNCLLSLIESRVRQLLICANRCLESDNCLLSPIEV